MPAKDVFHDTVKTALQRDGWIVTRENFRVQVDDEGLAMFIDLTAEKLISAEKAGRKIAVEVKSFRDLDQISTSFMQPSVNFSTVDRH